MHPANPLPSLLHCWLRQVACSPSALPGFSRMLVTDHVVSKRPTSVRLNSSEDGFFVEGEVGSGSSPELG